MERNLTTGSVGKNILLFSLPYLLSYFLQTLYGMADLFIIGQFDEVASTTAVSIGSQVMHMLTVMLVGLAMGTTVSIARAVGGRDHKQVSESVGNTVTLFFGLSIVLTAVLLLLVRPIVGVMSTPAEAVDGTVAYLTICFLGIPFITAYNIISSIFRGMGDSKSPMYFIAIACAANIALDYLFIGALDFGPAGAALGTTLAQTISVAVSLFMILRRKSISLSKGDFHPRRPVVGQILQIGVPVALQDGLIQIAFIVFVFLVPSSMLSTVSALGAQNIGAGKPERAVQTLRYAICITVGFGLCVCIGVQLCAEQLVALFTDRQAAGGAEVIRFGGQYLRSYILDCVFAGIHFSFSGYFCACGKSVLSFLHNISSVVLVRVPGSYLASTLFPDTLFPMGLASAGGSLLSVMLCILFYLKFCREKNPAAQSA